MSAEEVDAYLEALDEPKRSTLETVRRTILEIVPAAEQVISYRVPAFRTGGRTVAGLAAFRHHLSYLPFSGSVLPPPRRRAGGLHDDEERVALPRRPPLPEALIRKLIAARLEAD